MQKESKSLNFRPGVSLLFTTNYVELWTTFKLSLPWTLSALKRLRSLIRYSTSTVSSKKKKLLLAFLLIFDFFSCPSAGTWLSSSSAAAPSRAEGGNTFSVDYHTEKLPSACSAAALLLEDAAILQLLWGSPPGWVIWVTEREASWWRKQQPSSFAFSHSIRIIRNPFLCAARKSRCS